MMKKIKVYLSGKIRGCTDYKSIFRQAENQLRAMGYEEIFNPANKSEKSIRDAFAQDMEWICRHATHICMIWNYRDSLGSLSELALGRALNLKIIFLKEPKPKTRLKLIQREHPITCV
jgi:Domain of unknown function (DUF4406)